MANYLNYLNTAANLRQVQNQEQQQQFSNALNTRQQNNVEAQQATQNQLARDKFAKDQEQQTKDFLANGARTLAGLAKNPAMFNQAADFYANHPISKQVGIKREDITPESVQALVAQMSMNAGQTMEGGTNDAAVHSSFIGDNGNVWIVKKQGTTPVDTGVPATKFAPRVVQNDTGVYAFDPKTQRLSAPLTTQEAITQAAAGKAGAVEAAKTTAGARADAQVNLGSNLDEINKMREQVSGLLAEPGFNTIYGVSSIVDPRNYVRGTDAANAQARREQIDAQAFGISIQKMKGLGQLSNAEGSKVTAAFTRATNPKLSAVEAKKAWVEVQHYLDLAEQRVKQKAGQVPQQNSQPPAQQGPVRVSTPEEAMALPPGTQFQTPDGRVKVRP